jgi:hypothetical protein
MDCSTAEISHLIGYMQEFGHENVKKGGGGRFSDVTAAKQVIIQCHIFQTGDTYACLYHQ